MTRSRLLYIYDGLGVEGVEPPEGTLFSVFGQMLIVTAGRLTAVRVQWAPDGASAALCDDSSFCLVYEGSNAMGEDDKWDEVDEM